MTSTEMVTDFKIRTDWYETPMGTFPTRQMANEACEKVDYRPELCVTHKIEMSKVQDLIDAVNGFCGHLAEEYSYSISFDLRGKLTPRGYENTARIPEDFWRLIAFAVEGSNEGYYVHFGAILKDSNQYQEFGLAKTYSADSAYEMAKQTSRFLAAALWN